MIVSRFSLFQKLRHDRTDQQFAGSLCHHSCRNEVQGGGICFLKHIRPVQLSTQHLRNTWVTRRTIEVPLNIPPTQVTIDQQGASISSRDGDCKINCK